MKNEPQMCLSTHISYIYLWNRSKPCTCLKGDFRLGVYEQSVTPHCPAHSHSHTCLFFPPSTVIHNSCNPCTVIGRREGEHVCPPVCVFDRNMQNNKKRKVSLVLNEVQYSSHLFPCANLAWHRHKQPSPLPCHSYCLLLPSPGPVSSEPRKTDYNNNQCSVGR